MLMRTLRYFEKLWYCQYFWQWLVLIILVSMRKLRPWNISHSQIDVYLSALNFTAIDLICCFSKHW
jgi:hypothetical protein